MLRDRWTDGVKPLVEILYFEGCPNWQETRALVKRAASALPIEFDLRLVEVDDTDAAIEQRFLGSPSVRVNGSDVEPGADTRREYVFSCRVYRTEQGLAVQPSDAWVRDALARVGPKTGGRTGIPAGHTHTVPLK
jgi:hypothetical protein